MVEHSIPEHHVLPDIEILTQRLEQFLVAFSLNLLGVEHSCWNFDMRLTLALRMQ